MDNYSFLDLIWTLLVIYFLFFVLMILFTIVVDIFRSKDLSGFAKALWVILLVILPLIGALIYLIARHDSMAQRQLEHQQQQKQQFDSYVKEAARPVRRTRSPVPRGFSTPAPSRRRSSTR